VVTGSAQARQGFVAAIIPPLKCPPLGEIDVWVDVAVDSQNFTERMQRRLVVYGMLWAVALGDRTDLCPAADAASVLPTIPYSVTDEWWDLRCKGELCDLEIQCLVCVSRVPYRPDILLGRWPSQGSQDYSGSSLEANRIVVDHQSGHSAHLAVQCSCRYICFEVSFGFFLSFSERSCRYIYTGAVTLRPGDDSELGERAAVQLGAVRYMGQLWGLPTLAELSEARMLDCTDCLRVWWCALTHAYLLYLCFRCDRFSLR